MCIFLIFKKIENPYLNCMNCILVFQKKYNLNIIFRKKYSDYLKKYSLDIKFFIYFYIANFYKEILYYNFYKNKHKL